MRRVLTILLVGLTIHLLAARNVKADDGPLRMRSPTQCITEGGSKVALPPGVFLPQPTWDRLDAEVRRLQAEETRLGAENGRLRALTDSTAGRTLRYLAIGVGIGLAAGLAVGAYYF